jgi:hypothetical protein
MKDGELRGVDGISRGLLLIAVGTTIAGCPPHGPRMPSSYQFVLWKQEDLLVTPRTRNARREPHDVMAHTVDTGVSLGFGARMGHRRGCKALRPQSGRRSLERGTAGVAYPCCHTAPASRSTPVSSSYPRRSRHWWQLSVHLSADGRRHSGIEFGCGCLPCSFWRSGSSLSSPFGRATLRCLPLPPVPRVELKANRRSYGWHASG